MSHIRLVIRIHSKKRDPSAESVYYEWPDCNCGESAFFTKRQKCDFKTSWVYMSLDSSWYCLYLSEPRTLKNWVMCFFLFTGYRQSVLPTVKVVDGGRKRKRKERFNRGTLRCTKTRQGESKRRCFSEVIRLKTNSDV